MDSWIQPLHQLFIALAKFIESLGLLPKYDQDKVGRVAGIKFCGEGMCEEILFREPLVLVNGRIEYRSEVASGGRNIGLNASACGHDGHNR